MDNSKQASLESCNEILSLDDIAPKKEDFACKNPHKASKARNGKKYWEHQ